MFCNTNNHPIRVNQAENMLEMKREFHVVTVFRLVVVVVGGGGGGGGGAETVPGPYLNLTIMK